MSPYPPHWFFVPLALALTGMMVGVVLITRDKRPAWADRLFGFAWGLGMTTLLVCLWWIVIAAVIS